MQRERNTMHNGGVTVTLAEMARQLNTSTMAIYRRLKREGKDIREFRDSVTNEITPEGVAYIGGLFTTTDATNATTSTTTRTPRVTDHDAKQAEIDSAVLRERVTHLEAMLAATEAERDRLREHVDTLMAMLQAEQQQRQFLLTDGRQRRGLFGWFRRNRGTDGETDSR